MARSTPRAVTSSSAAPWTRSSASSATSSRSSSSSGSRRGPGRTSSSPRSATTPASRTSSCAGCAATGIGRPVIANAYILSPGVARAFHAGRVPGVVVTDELLALVERQAASPDKGRAFFLELAAKQAIVARGMGFAGVYLSGHRDAGEVRRVNELVEAHGGADWRPLVRDVSFGQPGAFHLFEPDGAGLSTDEPSRAYRASLAPAARARARATGLPVLPAQPRRARRVFEPGTPGFRTWAGIYGAVERAHLGRPLHVLEQAVKVPLYDCRDCGDCSLPDVAYLCPESHCAKNQRNGPCGGARDGRCETGDRPCIWARGVPPAQAVRRGAGDPRPGAGHPGQPAPAHERLGEHVPRTRPLRRAARRCRRRHPERIRIVRPDRSGTPFLVIGENIHATRVVKRAGRLAAELEDGSVGIAFEDADGERRILPVHPDLVTGRDFAAGRIKHVASAIRWGLDGDRHADLAAAYIRSMAARQEAAGADWLDLNVDEVAPDLRGPGARDALARGDRGGDGDRCLSRSTRRTSPCSRQASPRRPGPSGRLLLNSASLERPEVLDLAAGRRLCRRPRRRAVRSGMPANADGACRQRERRSCERGDRPGRSRGAHCSSTRSCCPSRSSPRRPPTSSRRPAGCAPSTAPRST